MKQQQPVRWAESGEDSFSPATCVQVCWAGTGGRILSGIGWCDITNSHIMSTPTAAMGLMPRGAAFDEMEGKWTHEYVQPFQEALRNLPSRVRHIV